MAQDVKAQTTHALTIATSNASDLVTVSRVDLRVINAGGWRFC